MGRGNGWDSGGVACFRRYGIVHFPTSLEQNVSDASQSVPQRPCPFPNNDGICDIWSLNRFTYVPSVAFPRHMCVQLRLLSLCTVAEGRYSLPCQYYSETLSLPNALLFIAVGRGCMEIGLHDRYKSNTFLL